MGAADAAHDMQHMHDMHPRVFDGDYVSLCRNEKDNADEWSPQL
jgi:hypothetical protein